jgi:hypothetical protein
MDNMGDKSGKMAAIKTLLDEVKSWKKSSMREKTGKEEIEIEDGQVMTEEPKEESDKEHDILSRLMEILGKKD